MRKPLLIVTVLILVFVFLAGKPKMAHAWFIRGTQYSWYPTRSFMGNYYGQGGLWGSGWWGQLYGPAQGGGWWWKSPTGRWWYGR